MEKLNGKKSHKRRSPFAGHWKAAAVAGGMLSSLRTLQVTSTGYLWQPGLWLHSATDEVPLCPQLSLLPPMSPTLWKMPGEGEKRVTVMDECSSLQERGGRERWKSVNIEVIKLVAIFQSEMHNTIKQCLKALTSVPNHLHAKAPCY